MFGHGVGDELLAIVSQRLVNAVRPNDLVARLGGDEFAVLARHLMVQAATSIALRALQALGEPILVGKNSHHVGSGIGISLIPSDAMTLKESLRKADVALYRANPNAARHCGSLNRKWIDAFKNGTISFGTCAPQLPRT